MVNSTVASLVGHAMQAHLSVAQLEIPFRCDCSSDKRFMDEFQDTYNNTYIHVSSAIHAYVLL